MIVIVEILFQENVSETLFENNQDSEPLVNLSPVYCGQRLLRTAHFLSA